MQLPLLPSINIGGLWNDIRKKIGIAANEVVDFGITLGETLGALREPTITKWVMKKFPQIGIKEVAEVPKIGIRYLERTYFPAIRETYDKMKEGKGVFTAYKEVWEEARAEERLLDRQIRDIYEKRKSEGASDWELATIGSQSPTFRRIAGMATTFIGDLEMISPEKQLTNFIKAAKPTREITEELYTRERAIRAGAGETALRQELGEEAYYKAIGRLKGEFPKISFEPIRDRLGQGSINYLYEKIKHFQRPGYDFYDTITTMRGLTKILSGEIPTRGEIAFLDEVFGPELGKVVMTKIPIVEKLGDYVADILNLPRALMTSMDMSAPLRQGAILVIDKPKIGWQSFKEMLKYFGSERIFQESLDEIRVRPTYPLMKEFGLDLTELGARLTRREEMFMSRFAERIPIVGRLVRASERAYVGFLNKMRADVFDDLVNEYQLGGVTGTNAPHVLRGIAEFINTATGRGRLPRRIAPAGPFLNGIFFAPRFMISRINMLNPGWYLKLHPIARKEAAKSFVKFVMTGVGILGLAKLGGFKVGTDSRSADFGKIRMGNVRWDVWGGFQQWTRFISQMILGEIKSSTTGRVYKLEKGQYPDITRWSQFIRFVRGKFAPIPALVADLMEGETVIGEEIRLGKSFYEKLTPIYIQDILEAIGEMGYIAIPTIGIPGFFGVGTQTYGPRPSPNKGKLNIPRLPSLPTLP